MKWFDYAVLLIAMLFMHVVADYNLQGCLSNMKRKAWWNKNYPDKKYRYDYIVALIMHGSEWSACIMLPLIAYAFLISTFVSAFVQYLIILCFIFNIIIHAIIDNLKANKHVFNLIEDQVIHIIQILVTWIVISRSLIG